MRIKKSPFIFFLPIFNLHLNILSIKVYIKTEGQLIRRSSRGTFLDNAHK